MEKYDSEIPASQVDTGTGKFALAVVFAATCVIIAGMVLDSQSVTLALTCGIGFFTFLVILVLLVHTGQLASAYRHYETEKTLRTQARWQYEVYMRELPQPPFPALEEVPQAILLNTYIPARPVPSEQVKVDAYAWVMRLFKHGELDPERVLGPETRSPGQVQAKKPSAEVLEYLLALEVVRGGGKGEMLFFNYAIYPSLRFCQQAIKYGVPRREHGRET